MARNILCTRCKKEKEPGRDNESYCRQCKLESRKERRAKKRADEGLPEWGSGRKETCSDCGVIKEYKEKAYCNACTNKRYNERYQNKMGLSIYCKCGNKKNSMRRIRCDDCQLEVNKAKWRKDAKKYRENEVSRYKDSVRGYTLLQIRSGRLIKQPCEVCGSKIVEAHHDDYEKPLDVRWLCKKHHAEHHKNNP